MPTDEEIHIAFETGEAAVRGLFRAGTVQVEELARQLAKQGEALRMIGMYKPRPIDTSHTELPATLVHLQEQLAENNHDLWAQQRLADGWTYGRRRHDGHKKHPDLVPYKTLPESEKVYDRITAMQTLKTILALGYRIVEPSSDEVTAFPDAVEAEVSEVSQRLRDPSPLDLQTLHKMQAIYPPDWWSSKPERAQLLGERLLKAGEPLLAYDVLTAGLQLSYKDVHLSKTDPPVLTYNILAVGIKLSPKDVRLWQLLALALARSGVPERANDILGQLRRAGYRDGETLGLLARTHKDLWMLATEAREREHQLRQAHELYAIGYRTAVRRARLDDAIYDGINAATTALLLGEAERARRLARQVRTRCQKRLQSGADYWAQASLGEAAVILGEDTAAADHYTKAAALGRGQLADLSSTRRTARWLADCLYGDSHRFDACFAIPRVVVFAGHMIDQPERPEPRFPAQLEPSIAKALAQRLETLQAGIGYASAACGADLLFLEAMQRRGGETHIVLPLPVEAFQRASVDIIPGANWGRRFRRVLQRATSTTVVNEHATVGSEVAYAYANFTQDGLALLRARILEATLTPLVVWDGRQGDGPGGTASLVEHWRSQGRAPEIIDLAPGAATSPPQPLRDVGRPATVAPPDSPLLTPSSPQEIKAMLFADVVGYSKLTEEELPRFVIHFLGAVAGLMAASPHAPLMQNTWGDALYFVFKNVEDAGLFALALRDRLCHISWTQYGLPADLILRIALHAGPVTGCVEPVTQHPNYFGSHVSWAARIEPITPHGQVYASQPFAALAAAQGVSSFTCDYVGQVPLAKKYGIFPTYHVRSRVSV